MYDTHQQALGLNLAVDQLALSLRAAKAAEHRQALREQRLERRSQRRQRRATRRTREAYTTAV